MFRRSINKFWIVSSRQTTGVAGGVRDSTEWSCATKKCLSTSSVLRKSSKTAEGQDDEDLDKPIKFTTSKAAQFTAQQSLGGNPFPNAPWYQPYVVSFSVGVFLLYFLALREENDIDEMMATPLWERIPGLEKQQLHVVLEYNRNHGLDTADIERRLKEIEMMETQMKQQQSSRQ